MRTELVRLAVRRFLAARTSLPFALAVLAAGLRPWRVPVLPGEPDASGALARGGVWTLLAAVGLVLLLSRATSLARAWRREEADWVGVLPLAPRVLVLSTWAGGLLAGGTLFLVAALLAEARAPGGAARRLVRTLEHPAAVLVGSATRARVETGLSLDSLPPGATLRIRPATAPGSGPAATVVARGVSAATGEGGPAVRARVSSRRALELPLPAPGRGALVLALEREGEGAAVVLPRGSVDLLVPAASVRLVSVALLERVLLALAGWLALALALGTVLRPSIASLSLLALALVPWVLGRGASWLPGGDLPLALELAGEGLVAPALGLPPFVATLLVALVGLGGATRGLARGRSLT